MYRTPIAAGKFYEGNKSLLLSQIERCFDHILGPKKGFEYEKEPVACVVPHAGYEFSGHIAAHSYAALKKTKTKKIVIIGPNHTGQGQNTALCGFDGWETPLGLALVDKGLTDFLARYLPVDNLSHKSEHSIEVQIPFLQYIFKDFSFAPVSMLYQDIESVNKVFNALEKLAGKEDFTVIASSDLTHYETAVKAKEKDKYILNALRDMDADGLINAVRENSITSCGHGPMAAAVKYALLKNARSEILRYATSGDVYPMEEVVAYASVVFGK